ncbi:MAG: hypothetical protein RL266_703 [Bacteroidota bacterium]|jgi:hypothetical protein
MESNVRKIWIALSIGLNCHVVQSQTPLFTEESVQRGVNFVSDHFWWGNGVSCYDWNKDGWPDISLCATGVAPAFYQNNGDGTFSTMTFNISNTHEAKSLTWADYDNDGDADIFLTRVFGPWSLYRNDGGFMFTEVTNLAGLGQLNFYQTMGASWSDINNDGFLDLYICNYNWNDGVTNKLYLNNGNGLFTDFSVQSGANNGSHASFQSVFADFNLDGLPDISLTNDRHVSENALYINTGNGIFSNQSQAAGINVAVDAMSNSVEDFDNDGDFDIYVSNHDDGNLLFQNNGDTTFTNIAANAGVTVNQVCWSAIWLDQDLDGWQDLFVATSPLDPNNPETPTVHNYFFSNQQDMTFNYRADSGMEPVVTRSYCGGSADLDNNGAPDLVLSGKEPYGAEIWMNTTQDHSSITLSLEGTISNRDGIGSTVRCYSGGTVQTRYTKCGEGHLSQNSQYLLFGLGSESMADSLTITWPSGIVDRLYSIAADQFLHIMEGSTISPVSVKDWHQQDPQFIIFGHQLTVRNSSVSTLALLDVSGRCIASTQGSFIDLFGIRSGIYILQWTSSSGSGSNKILIP